VVYSPLLQVNGVNDVDLCGAVQAVLLLILFVESERLEQICACLRTSREYAMLTQMPDLLENMPFVPSITLIWFIRHTWLFQFLRPQHVGAYPLMKRLQRFAYPCKLGLVLLIALFRQMRFSSTTTRTGILLLRTIAEEYPMPTTTVPKLTLTPADVAHLADTLRPYHEIYGSFFPRSESRTWAAHYLHGLLSPRERTSVEPMVIAQFGASERLVRGMQQFLTDSTWDDTAILRRHGHEVAKDLDDAEGMFIVDGSDFPKKGRQSVEVKRQYCGQLGKIANCQAGVFLAYTSMHGTTLLDRRLYLPQEWVDDPAFAVQRHTCHIPEDVVFHTKNELALAMLQDVVASHALHARWFLADEAFGRDTVLLDAVDALGLWYTVEVPLDTPVWRDGATQATTAQGPVHRPARHGLDAPPGGGRHQRATHHRGARAARTRPACGPGRPRRLVDPAD